MFFQGCYQRKKEGEVQRNLLVAQRVQWVEYPLSPDPLMINRFRSGGMEISLHNYDIFCTQAFFSTCKLDLRQNQILLLIKHSQENSSMKQCTMPKFIQIEKKQERRYQFILAPLLCRCCDPTILYTQRGDPSWSKNFPPFYLYSIIAHCINICELSQHIITYSKILNRSR